MTHTVPFPTTTEPTTAERLQALETTVYRLTVERDHARWERDRADAVADIKTAVATNLRTELNTACTELRRANERCRELAEANESLTHDNERMRNDPQPSDPTRRWPFRRLGNQL